MRHCAGRRSATPFGGKLDVQAKGTGKLAGRLRHVGQEVEVVSPNRAEIEGSKAISILVSVPPEGHLITVLDPAVEEPSHEKCLCEV